MVYLTCTINSFIVKKISENMYSTNSTAAASTNTNIKLQSRVAKGKNGGKNGRNGSSGGNGSGNGSGTGDGVDDDDNDDSNKRMRDKGTIIYIQRNTLPSNLDRFRSLREIISKLKEKSTKDMEEEDFYDEEEEVVDDDEDGEDGEEGDDDEDDEGGDEEDMPELEDIDNSRKRRRNHYDEDPAAEVSRSRTRGNLRPLKTPRTEKSDKSRVDINREFMDMVRSRSRDHRHSSNIETCFASLSRNDQQKALDAMQSLNDQSNEKFYPVLIRVLLSKMTPEVRQEVVVRYENDSKKGEGGKFITWLDSALRIPFGTYKERLNIRRTSVDMKEFFDSAKQHLDASVAGHDEAKHKIIQFLGQLINNPTSNGTVLGIEGPMGVGKTTLIEKGVSKVLDLPFFAIPLGGASDASFLNGHSYTYEGSIHGQIVDVLMKAKVMNPIIYFDELDKVSETQRGQEIINLLIHLVDPAQNTHFQDRYFGNMNIDVSKCTFIFSYNNASSINPILRDRIFEVKVSGFTLPQKVSIARKHLLPQVLREVGLGEMEKPNFSDDILGFIAKTYTFEGGVRKFKECLLDIIREVNLERLVCKRKKFALSEENIRSKYLKHRRPIIPERIHAEPRVGKINGLYATSNETGGILPIESSWLPSDQTMVLAVTGNLGKVMQESAQVSRTLAWKLTDENKQKRLMESWKDSGKMNIHIHCQEGAVEKEGPSAGVALTTVIYSLINNRKINHKVGVTGEINLSGDVLMIGGLKQKLHGAKSAGITLALFPASNAEDFKKLEAECPELFMDDFRAIPISTVSEALQYLLLGEDEESSSPIRHVLPVQTNATSQGDRQSQRLRKV